MGSASYLFQRIKLCNFTKLHDFIFFCSIFANIPPKPSAQSRFLSQKTKIFVFHESTCCPHKARLFSYFPLDFPVKDVLPSLE